MSKKLLLFVGLFLVVGLALWYKKDQLPTVFNGEKPEAKVSYSLPESRTYESPMALPKPRVSGGMAVERTLQERRSRREFSEEPVTLLELSQLLWAGQGITDPETGHRAAPSARGAYPFTLFVVVRNVTGLEPGLYEYLPTEHALGDLNLANAGDLLKEAGVQPGAQSAPVVFLLSASYGKAQETLGDSAVESSLLEAGHIGQNMYLQTESLGMSMVVMGGFESEKVVTALLMDPAETVVYLMPFGNRAPDKAVLGQSVDTSKTFTAEELAQYDGKEGRKAYAAYEGKVYDFSASDKWKDGEHYGLSAGQDLTGKLGEAPHGGEVVEGFPVVGTFGTIPQAETVQTPSQNNMLYYILGGVGAVAVVGVVMSVIGKKK